MKVSPIQAAIEKATSENLLSPNVNYNTEVKDIINSRPDIPKEAILHLKKRVVSRNQKVQFLTFELLDYLVLNTALPFHTQVASRDFLATLSQIYRSKDCDAGIKKRLKEILLGWCRRFGDARDILPGFQDIYNQLKLGGEVESVSPIAAKIETPVNQGHRPLPPAKAEKLRKDLQVVRENISLTNEIIRAGERAENETLVELVTTLRAMEGKIIKLVEKLEDLEVLEYCLLIKDELQETLNRYQALKQGKLSYKSDSGILFDPHYEASKVQESGPSRHSAPVHDLLFESPPPPSNIIQNNPNLLFSAPNPASFSNQNLNPVLGGLHDLDISSPPLLQERAFSNPISAPLDPFSSLVITQEKTPSNYTPPSNFNTTPSIFPQNIAFPQQSFPISSSQPSTQFKNSNIQYSNPNQQYINPNPQYTNPSPLYGNPNTQFINTNPPQIKSNISQDQPILTPSIHNPIERPTNNSQNYSMKSSLKPDIEEKKNNFDELFDFKF